MAFKAMRSVCCERCSSISDLGFVDWWPPLEPYEVACECGGNRFWVPEGFVTDVYGSPVYSDAVGGEVSSSRERDKIMRESHHMIGDSGYSVKGYEPCGDKVGGARPDLSLKRTAFSGGGFTGSRVSTGERALSRKPATSR